MTTNSTLGDRVAHRLREQSPGLDVGTLEPLLGAPLASRDAEILAVEDARDLLGNIDRHPRVRRPMPRAHSGPLVVAPLGASALFRRHAAVTLLEARCWVSRVECISPLAYFLTTKYGDYILEPRRVVVRVPADTGIAQDSEILGGSRGLVALLARLSHLGLRRR